MFTLQLLDPSSEAVSSAETGGSKLQVWRDSDGLPCAYGQTVEGRHWMHFPELASYCFLDDSDIVFAVPKKPVRPHLIEDAFNRSVVPMALQARGREVMHASGVRTEKGVVAFCAVSGTGKSTIAYALGRRGYQVWADDAVAWELNREQADAFSIPFGIRLRPQSATYFGMSSSGAVLNAGCEEFGLAPERLAAVVALSRKPDGVPVEMVRLSPAAALRTVLTHAYSFGDSDAARKRRMSRHYLDLVARVPIYEVKFVPQWTNMPSILNTIEQKLIEL